MAYLPIEDHGIIGNLRTVALVGMDGTIDWCCAPHFDSPSVFGSILDDQIGGCFRLTAQKCVHEKQHYLPDSAVLVTKAYTEHGVGQIHDLMTIGPADEKHPFRIVRCLSCVRGEVHYDLECRPAFNYGRSAHQILLRREGALFEPEGGPVFALSSPVPLRAKGSAVSARLVLKEGQHLDLVFFLVEDTDRVDSLPCAADVEAYLRETLDFWQEWMKSCNYRERWSEMVSRSAIVLKLLTFQPTGAIVAAPTVGLPEVIGGARNWDYRYTWIRDAAFTLYALMRIGFTEEAHQFMQWVMARCAEVDVTSPTPLHLMYGIHGEKKLDETLLEHLQGYRNSKPVRLGNAAYRQLQLDIYGELMDAVYLYNKYSTPISYQLWQNCRRIVEWVAANWNQPDEGIWETRGGRHDFVYSRLMCWVALDRATRMALKHSMPGHRVRWSTERDRIYDEIMTKGWNDKKKAFRQHYDTDALDASTLLMSLVKFISPTDPRMLSTIDAILNELTTDSLVYRYDTGESPDGLSGREGTFCMCTFWLVECLTRAGRLKEARLIFEKMLGYANHLGLFAEEIGQHGEALSNFPQALTHLSLISAAYNLNRALSMVR